jgi:hypothetical protein
MLEGDFETHFRRFVQGCEGELIPEANAERADFLFPKDNVIAELKTLREDARQEHAQKLQALADDWARRGLIRAYGRVVFSLQKMNPECQREWLRILQAPVVHLVRKANRQIRSAKESLGRPSAKGLLLIANDGNLLHTSPVDYMILVSRVLQKKTPTGERQFPHIHGVIYFSYQIPSRNEGMPFWASGHTNPKGDFQMQEFQKRLRSQWYAYVQKMTGLPVAEVAYPIPK